MRHWHLLSNNYSEALAKFVFNVAIPILLFINTANAELSENFQWEILVIYYSAALIAYVIAMQIGRLTFNFSLAEQSSYGMGAAYSNTTVIGIPICLHALGSDSLIPLFAIISIQSLLMFVFGFAVIERITLKFSTINRLIIGCVKQLATNPITASLIIGIAVNIIGISLYQPINDALKLFSTAAVPAALFVLGCSLYNYQLSNDLKPAMAMISIKLVGLPLLVWVLAYHVFAIDKLWADTVLIAAALPVGISAYIFAKNTDGGESTIATGIVLSSILSIFSISLILTFII